MAFIRPFLLLAAAATFACGAEPQLQVETAPAAEPAAQTAPGAPEVQAAHEPAAAPAGDQLPEGHPPLDAMQAGGFELAPVDPAAGRGEAGMSWQAPAGWVAEPPANSMRRAQYKVPGPGGEGECVVFYFGPGQGGSPQANAERWAAQFEQPDGRSPLDAMTTRELDGAATKTLVVEVAGTYQSGSMMGGPATESKPGWALLGAVVEGTDANWFFKFTGPEATVTAHREAFEKMIRSVSPGG